MEHSLPLALLAVPGRAGKSSLCIWNPGTLSTGFDSCPATEATKLRQATHFVGEVLADDGFVHK